MERTRLVFFVAIAFFSGAFLAALAFSEGAGFPGAAPASASRIVVEIENSGPHDARADVRLSLPEGGGVGRWNVDVPAGDSARVYADEPPQARLVVLATLSYEAGAGESGRGDYGTVADPRECDGGDLLVRLFVDTAQGVVFQPATKACR